MGSFFSSCLKSKQESYAQDYVKCCETQEEFVQIWPGFSDQEKHENRYKNYKTMIL